LEVTEEDFDPSLGVALKPVVESDLLLFLTKVVDCIHINLLIYTELVQAKKLALDYFNIGMEQKEGVAALNQLAARIQASSNITEIEMLKEQYIGMVSLLLKKVSDMPYMGWSWENAEYENSKVPYTFEPKNLSLTNHRVELLKSLLQLEESINVKLKELNIKPVCQIYAYYEDKTNLAQAINLRDQYIQYVRTMEEQLDIYKKGKYLLFKPDTGKVQIFTELVRNILKISNNSIGDAILQSYGFLLAAIQNHQAYIIRRGISEGELIKYFYTDMTTLQRMLDQINEASDDNFLQSISNEADAAGPAPVPAPVPAL